MGRQNILAIIFGVAALTGASAAMAYHQTDAQLRKRLIGTWHIPANSMDRRSDNANTIEVYRADGMYLTVWFADASCAKIVKLIHLKWSIDQDVLTTSVIATGQTMKDQIVSVGARKLVLHSLDDGSTYQRERTRHCTGAVP
jgi:hypothetical protein